MVLKKIIPVLLALSISGCAAASAARSRVIDEEKVRTFASIYRKAKEAHKADPAPGQSIRLTPDAGDDVPYFPVYEPGRVEKVWVPAHVSLQDKGVFVAGHWAFVMVEEPHWYIEDHDARKVAVPVIFPTAPRKE